MIPTSYIEDLKPLNDLIEIIFRHTVISELNINFIKYKENFMGSKTARQEYLDQIKLHVKSVLKLTSSPYKRKLLKLYFSQDGLVMFIFSNLTNKYESYYQEKLENYNQ